MAASVRLALAVVWEEEQSRPYLRAKLLDLVLVFCGVALLLVAFVANVSLQLLTSYGTEIADRLGLERFDGEALGTLGQTATTLALTIAALLALYRLAPSAPWIRDLLPGAIVGGIGVHLAVLGFSVYVGVMAGFEEIYGALAGLFGFLFLVYLVASAIVFGAEVVRRGPKPRSPAKRRGRRSRSANAWSALCGGCSARRAVIRRPRRADGKSQLGFVGSAAGSAVRDQGGVGAVPHRRRSDPAPEGRRR